MDFFLCEYISLYLPGIDLKNLAFPICPFQIPAKMYSMRFALHKKLNTRRYFTMHSGVKTYFEKWMVKT